MAPLCRITTHLNKFTIKKLPIFLNIKAHLHISTTVCNQLQRVQYLKIYTALLYCFPPENCKIYNTNVLLKYFCILNIGFLHNLKEMNIYSFTWDYGPLPKNVDWSVWSHCFENMYMNQQDAQNSCD